MKTSFITFITTFNPNNRNICSTIKSPLISLKNNNGFYNIKLIQSKRQSPNLKKLLTKAEFGEVYLVRLTVVTKNVNAATISRSMITTPLKTFKLLLN